VAVKSRAVTAISVEANLVRAADGMVGILVREKQKALRAPPKTRTRGYRANTASNMPVLLGSFIQTIALSLKTKV
jgi:hypothetical protein